MSFPKAFYSQVDEFFVLRSNQARRVFSFKKSGNRELPGPHAAGKVRAVFPSCRRILFASPSSQTEYPFSTLRPHRLSAQAARAAGLHFRDE